MVRFCIICGKSKEANRTIHLYPVPKDENERRKWMDATGKNLSVNSYVCSNHFSGQRTGSIKLEKGSLPRIISRTSPVLFRKYIETGSFQANLVSTPVPENPVPISFSDSPGPSQANLGFTLSSSPDVAVPNSFTDINTTCQQQKTVSIISAQDLHADYKQPINVKFDYEIIKQLFSSIKHNEILINLPRGWSLHKLNNAMIFSKIALQDNSVPYVERSVVLTNNSVYVSAINKSINMEEKLTSENDLVQLIKNVDLKKLCKGYSPSCKIFILQNTDLCRECCKYKYFVKKREEKKRKCFTSKNKKKFYLKKRNERLSNIVSNLKKSVIDSDKIDKYIKDLPTAQKNMIQACCKAGQSRKTGKRYTLDWMYSCILMRMKSPKLYRHIRDNDILPLPCQSTISKYIRNIDTSFGFQKEVFALLKEKAKNLPEWEKHGCLLIDECKVTASKKFDKNTMEFIGFVDLGEHTPNIMENNLGDHALVLMFQPFAGRGLQALACFLSGGDVTGEILAKIILECVILCENSGFYIDLVTSDGATWNRKMWTQLGIENDLQPWCVHPMDPKRRLRMCSDFPHLIKCLRNNLIKKKQFRIPEGLVNFSDFENLLEYESKKEFRFGFKLTESHIHPKSGEKMNTRLAFQLFSNTSALALEIYKNKDVKFEKADPTISLCRRLNHLIDIMNSSSPDTGLRLNSQEYEDLDTFLIYLDLWKQCSPPKIFLSDSTFHGLRATISSTRDLTKYLNSIGFKYLMTSRINQDHLEHFFGMMRAAGGCNSHPESIQVGQIFRLMSLYSLIKPPRGSNVTGGEMMQSLLNVGDLKEKKQNLIFDIQIGNTVSEMEEVFTEVDEAFAYFCGYVTKKMKNTNKCLECVASITGEGNEIFNTYIKNKSRGFLTFPSTKMIDFLQEVEMKISAVFKEDLKRNTLSIILEKLSNFFPRQFLGCPNHQLEFSKETLKSYLISRLSICCTKEHQKRASTSKFKHFSKLAKLC